MLNFKAAQRYDFNRLWILYIKDIHMIMNACRRRRGGSDDIRHLHHIVRTKETTLF